MQYSRNGNVERKYNWKDLLIDIAIVAVALGGVALIIGSFPVTFSKFLPFLK